MPTALIVTALKVEAQAVLRRLTSTTSTTGVSGNRYRRGSFRKWEVWVVQTGQGNDAAAAITRGVLSDVKPDVVLFVGVAGGVKDLAVGDVVASSRIRAYEGAKEVGRRVLPRETGGPASHPLEQAARDLSLEARRSRSSDRPGGPAAFVAPIAAGAKLVASRRGPTAALLKAQFSDVLAVEMEGAGFAEAARVAGTSWLIVRGISDLLGAKTATERTGSQQVASENASAFAFELLDAFEPPSEILTAERMDAYEDLPTNCRSWLVELRGRDKATHDQLVAQLRSTAAEPIDIVSDLDAAPPPWLLSGSPMAWICVAAFAEAHLRPLVASRWYERAARAGEPRPFRWLARAAVTAIAGGDRDRGNHLINEAFVGSPDDPFVQVMRGAAENDTESLRNQRSVQDLGREERLAIEVIRARALAANGDQISALSLLANLQVGYPERAGPLVERARLSLHRALEQKSPDRLAELQLAADLALKARGMQLKWRGDTTETVNIAATAHIELGEAEAVLAFTMPPPVGSATKMEGRKAAELAAKAALIAGRTALLPEIISQLDDGFGKLMFQAMLDKRRGHPLSA